MTLHLRTTRHWFCWYEWRLIAFHPATGQSIELARGANLGKKRALAASDSWRRIIQRQWHLEGGNEDG